MRDRLIELFRGEISSGGYNFKLTDRCGDIAMETLVDYLLANGVIVLPCKIGQTVYEIEPLWYEIWRDNEHKCRKCEHFYEGGMGDNPDCNLGKNCCYHIVEKEADVRSLADWVTPNIFTNKIDWGKTVFLTREQAEKALAEVANGT